MKIEIKHRYTNSALFSHDEEENTLKITLLMALKAGANLGGADLGGEEYRAALVLIKKHAQLWTPEVEEIKEIAA